MSKLAEFKKNYPDIYQAAFDEGLESGIQQGKEEGIQTGKEQSREQAMSDGAAAERERIQAVEEQTIPGHEKLIQELKFDGKTTGPEAAVQILAAEKKIRGKAAQNLESDSQAPVDNSPPLESEAQLESPVDSEGNFDREKATELFNKTPALKKEFGNDLDTYLAYAQAAAGGHVRELKNKA